MMRSRSFILCLALTGVALLGGCRTYGDNGYGTQTKTYEALQTTVQSFEKELSRATSDLHQLEEAAAQEDTLHALVGQYQTVLEEHTSFLKTQRQRLDRLSAEASYRSLHSAYGATVTEQRMIQQKYQRILRSVHAAVNDSPVASAKTSKKRRYTIQPIHFPAQGDSMKRLTMERALQGM